MLAFTWNDGNRVTLENRNESTGMSQHLPHPRDEQLTDNVFRSMPIVLRGVNQVEGGTDNEMPRIHACDSLIGGRELRARECLFLLSVVDLCGDSGYCVAVNTGWCKSK